MQDISIDGGAEQHVVRQVRRPVAGHHHNYPHDIEKRDRNHVPNHVQEKQARFSLKMGFLFKPKPNLCDAMDEEGA